jgi:hypothetical protein
MSRRGWSDTNFLSYAAGVVTAAPLTMACWVKTSITGTAQSPMSLNNTASILNRNEFDLRLTSGNQVSAAIGDSVGFSQSNAPGTFTANTWFHAAAVFASATSRTAYFNGAASTPNTTSRVPSGINGTSIGKQLSASPGNIPLAPAGTGDIGEAAIWNVALTDADIAALAAGLSPLLVRPDALVGYWPLLGVGSPENNLVSNVSRMTITGSLSQSEHPRVFLPKRPVIEPIG